ncbi:MAG: carbohydrate porin, partial [Bdellovibrionota bacterium]
MRKIFFSGLVLLSAPVLAQERTPAMDDHQGRTVVLETVNPDDKPALHWEAAYIGEIGRNFSGGAFVGSTYSGLATLRASYDLEKAFGINGITLFSHFQGSHGAHPSDYVGDAQGTSSIQAKVDTAKLYELWIKKESTSKQASILFGILDLNSEFYTTSTSGVFLNNSFGVGADISQTSGPSIFPTPGLATRIRIQTEDSFYLQTAV